MNELPPVVGSFRSVWLVLLLEPVNLFRCTSDILVQTDRATTEWCTLKVTDYLLWPVPCSMADLLQGHTPDRFPRPVEEEEIEVEVHWLSGRNSLIRIGWESTPRKLREVLRSLWSLTLYDLAGELLEFDKPLRHQVGMEHDKYQLQAIVQHPCLVCNEQAAILWYPNNPFLCGIGAGSYGNCLDSTGTPFAVPIKHVFGGKSWFLAVKADQTIISWG